MFLIGAQSYGSPIPRSKITYLTGQHSGSTAYIEQYSVVRPRLSLTGEIIIQDDHSMRVLGGS